MNKIIIPVLLLKDNVLYKTEKFKKPKYIGDPINAVKILVKKNLTKLLFWILMHQKKIRNLIIIS